MKPLLTSVSFSIQDWSIWSRFPRAPKPRDKVLNAEMLILLISWAENHPKKDASEELRYLSKQASSALEHCMVDHFRSDVQDLLSSCKVSNDVKFNLIVAMCRLKGTFDAVEQLLFELDLSPDYQQHRSIFVRHLCNGGYPTGWTKYELRRLARRAAEHSSS